MNDKDTGAECITTTNALLQADVSTTEAVASHSNKFPAKNGPPKCPEIAECDANTSLGFCPGLPMTPRCQRGWDYRNWCSNVAAHCAWQNGEFEMLPHQKASDLTRSLFGLKIVIFFFI